MILFVAGALSLLIHDSGFQTMTRDINIQPTTLFFSEYDKISFDSWIKLPSWNGREHSFLFSSLTRKKVRLFFSLYYNGTLSFFLN